jgi:hypothetical protein
MAVLVVVAQTLIMRAVVVVEHLLQVVRHLMITVAMGVLVSHHLSQV